MSLLTTPIESAPAPSFFDLAIKTRDQAILEKDRAIYELMEDMKAKDRIINELCHQVFQQRKALSAKSELAEAAELLTSFATSVEEASASDTSTSTTGKSHKQLKHYLEDGDILHHNITKCNSWSASWDRTTNKLVRSEGAIYNSPSQFAAAHRTACGKKPACNAWAECTVLRMDEAGESYHVYIKDLERIY